MSDIRQNMIETKTTTKQAEMIENRAMEELQENKKKLKEPFENAPFISTILKNIALNSYLQGTQNNHVRKMYE